ncbi:MAG: 2-oxoacid:acceptor oxidoreductase subunit alpha [Planctomycetota bacterium]
MTKTIEQVSKVVIRFSGDSGDGMQLTGSQFSRTSAVEGNDISTLADFPAEIRAPIGTLYGVSGFQMCFGDHKVHTAGDEVDVLVAMNPASLKTSLAGVRRGGTLILNEDTFTQDNLDLAKYRSNPLEDGSLAAYKLILVPLGKLTEESVKGLGLTAKQAGRSKNMFALGIVIWMYSRSLEQTIDFVKSKFSGKPELLEANLRVIKAGHAYAETAELFETRYEVGPAKLPKGRYRSVEGNQALALGLVAASTKSGLDIFFGSYPITPASSILHTLAKHKEYGVKTFQAEDEIAAVCSAIGASYAGNLGVTCTSGPGLALKAEAIGLAVMTELPLVIIDVQRAGPSTGMPTKTEQSDLYQAMYGRNGECPVAVVCTHTPGDCFYAAYEAVRLAVKYRHPVILLSDGYIANGAEPWRIPAVDSLADIKPDFASASPDGGFRPYARNPETLARPWALPGVPGNEHRIGGIEKEDGSGNISYDPENHQKMVALRAAKVRGMAKDIPAQEVFGSREGDVLVLGWGGTHGALRAAVENQIKKGRRVAHAQLRHLNPFPSNLEDIVWKYRHVLIPEWNAGQLATMVRSQYLVPARSYSKVMGIPFTVLEIENEIEKLLELPS